jgi:hypothetical protein
VVKYLVEGVPIEETILASKDMKDFLCLRSVTGGGQWGDEYLGKAVRWYYSKDKTQPITYCKNGNKVPKTDGCRPMMDLETELPKDLDYGRYIAEAKKMLQALGLVGQKELKLEV